MKEFAIENIDDALDIVSGDKLHCYKFDSLMESGEYDEETLKMMTSKLTANCENKLEILSPENLDTLYNTFVDKQDDKDYYKVAFNKVTEAIDNVIKKFNAGDAKIGGGDIAYLEALIEKRTKDAEKAGADKNDYDEAKKNLAEFAKEYDEKYNLNDFNENTIELMDNNFEKMHSYQQDDESSNVPYESHIVKIKPENFSDFLAKKINNKDDVTYSDCASVILSFRGKDWLDVKGNLFKRITEKINKKQPIEGEDLAGANAILKILSNKVEDIKEYTGEKKKLLELKKELTKQIDQSTKFALHNQVVKDIEQLVINNIEITKDRGLFWNKKISQKDRDGKLKKDSEIDLWLRTIRECTKLQMLGCKNLTRDKFNDAYATNVYAEYIKLLEAQKIVDPKARGKEIDTNDPKAVKKAVKSANKDLAGKRKHNINRHIIVGSVATLMNDNESFKSRLSHKIERTIDSMENVKIKIGKIITANKLLGKVSDSIKEIDAKCTNKFGGLYTHGKAVAKTVMWVGAASMSGGLFVWAPAIVHGSRFAIAAYKFSRGYFDEKKKHRETSNNWNKKTYRFRDYLEKNPDQVTGLVCLGCGAAGSLLGDANILSKSSFVTCCGAAIIKAVKDGVYTYKKETGADIDEARREKLGMKNDKKSNNKDTFKKGRGKAIAKAVVAGFKALGYSVASYAITRWVSGVSSGVQGSGDAHATAFSDVGDVGHHSDASHGSHGSHDSHDSSISDGEPGASEKDLSGKNSSNSRRIRKVEKNKDPLDVRNYNIENTPKVCDAATLAMNKQVSR